MMTCLYLCCYIFCFQWGCQIKEICGQYALWDKESMITTNFWSGQHHTTLSTIIESWKQQQAWSYEAQVAPEIIDNASLFNHALGWHQANQPSSNNPIFGSQINIWTGRDRYWKITKDIFKSLLNQEKPVLYLLLLFCQPGWGVSKKNGGKVDAEGASHLLTLMDPEPTLKIIYFPQAWILPFVLTNTWRRNNMKALVLLQVTSYTL